MHLYLTLPPSYTHLRCQRLALYHKNDGLCRKPCRCKRRRGFRVMGKREHALSPSAYKSADRERASSLFVCPAIRLCLLASLSCYIPLLWPCRTFFNAHIFIFDTSPALLRNTAGDFSVCQNKVFVGSLNRRADKLPYTNYI